ncbi:geminin-like isoform X2 [Dreissena polymorpha]|uniref:geminin-like isoform X2 n=1 Tax=Dreissena polymorpha TaxID=45954 RepID=UPI0022640C75|nr:geminin-like isoform X2 [Dreissena polymorpha]
MSEVDTSGQVNKENLYSLSQPKKMAITVKDERRTLKTLQLTPVGKLSGVEKPAKTLIQTKIFPSTKPVKVFEDKPRVPSPLARSVQEMCIQASPESSEVEVQTDPSELEGATGGRGDAHNDSGVGADQEAYDLMVKDPIPESYWRELAEERRLSLAEALAENEALHQSMEELKEENLNLSLLAGQAEHLASILDDALSSDADDTAETSEPTADQNKEGAVDSEQPTQTS